MGLISYFLNNNGWKESGDEIELRTIRLTVTINAIFFVVLLSFVALIQVIDPEDLIRTWFFASLACCSLLFIVLIRYNYSFLARFLTAFLPMTAILAFRLIITPTANIFFIEPYDIITLSLIPQLIFDYRTEKFWYWAGIVYFFLLFYFHDVILFSQIPDAEAVTSIIQRDYVVYKLVLFSFWLIPNVSIFYLNFVNRSFFKTIQEDQKLIKKQNYRLQEQQEELQAQNEELIATNEDLDLRNIKINDAMEKLKEAQSRLVQSEKMASIGVLTAGIAHEINNPVNYISNGTRALNKSLKDLLALLELYEKTEASDHIEIKSFKEKIEFDNVVNMILATSGHIESGAEKTKNIVKSLRYFSRSNMEKLTSMNINEAIDNTLELLNHKTKNRVSIKKSYCENAEIEANPGKINQALMNIISNAVDSVEEQGIIEISTSRTIYNDDPAINIQVSDTGSGIPDEIKEKIFDPFFSTKALGKGTGLGLSITMGIIKDHSGKIDMRSTVGKGTTFEILLPIVQKSSNELKSKA